MKTLIQRLQIDKHDPGCNKTGASDYGCDCLLPARREAASALEALSQQAAEMQARLDWSHRVLRTVAVHRYNEGDKQRAECQGCGSLWDDPEAEAHHSWCTVINALGANIEVVERAGIVLLPDEQAAEMRWMKNGED